MKEQARIPTSKVERASRFIRTGAKVGGNYIKHYSKKLLNSECTREELDAENAADIYQSLSELKGSALKVAQMLSMDKNALPPAYQDKFSLSQYSAPPLSYPLVVKTFQTYLGKGPDKIFDSFSKNAVNAASIGQVHQAELNGKKLAVKIQYPGVSDSISSDLRMVRPIAAQMFNVSKSELDLFFGEVESKLLEETDYELEVRRSMELSKKCAHLKHVVFPKYYPELSGERIIVMDWLDGLHLKDWLDQNPSQKERNRIGQALWHFYDYQMHTLKQVHADPHPGNFIITSSGELGIIDFGCVKVVPDEFYDPYFKLLEQDISQEDHELEALFTALGFLSDADSEKDKMFFMNIFKEMIELLGRPFRMERFDFGNDEYFQQIFEAGERVSKMKEFRKSKTARGNKDGLYINRTYFGLYNLLNMLKANVETSTMFIE
ncbi:AarF/ABC1/UbiB kinase family protein [Fulvivirga sp. 29W222]|uniref:AarF/ABC1/UbiB kinase family protein n=1 Tax=Fulvivirga marina TaxID=2494733 RepID=A0A937FZW7_9BACT|nr:AarF/ABC1/UbiB kinase family protein [Fulvivirga marina]MBL6449244.1 AarF/ABC1/UbiB kinase family protein [Fulvivirga marina]